MYQISPKLSDLGLKSSVMLAPMAGITDLILRQIVRSYNSNILLTSEMISSEALKNNKNCKVINKIEDLKNDALIKIRDKYYEKYLKIVGFCKQEDIQRLSNEILGKAKSEASKVNVDMNISRENIISLMIADFICNHSGEPGLYLISSFSITFNESVSDCNIKLFSI